MFSLDSEFGVFDVAALVLTLVGLYIAWFQARAARVQALAARDAADAAENTAAAARDAISTTERKLGRNQLIAALVGVQQVISDVDAAAENENKAVMQFSLVRLGVVATEAALLVDHHLPSHDSLAVELRRSSEDALVAKSNIARSASLKVARVTEPVRGDLGRLNLRATTAVTLLRSTSGEGI